METDETLEIKNDESKEPPKKSWARKYSESIHADKWLALFSFAEASFFPLPPSTLMIAIMSSAERHKRWFYYASLTTITSVLGGLFGYLIGFVFYDTLGQTIIEVYGLAEDIEKVNLSFQDNAFWAIFIAAFTPIPYKVFTLAAGFFNINVFVFITASLLGRGIRYYAVAFFVSVLGEKASRKAMVYLNYFALIVAAIVILYFLYKLLRFFIF